MLGMLDSCLVYSSIGNLSLSTFWGKNLNGKVCRTYFSFLPRKKTVALYTSRLDRKLVLNLETNINGLEHPVLWKSFMKKSVHYCVCFKIQTPKIIFLKYLQHFDVRHCILEFFIKSWSYQKSLSENLHIFWKRLCKQKSPGKW